MKNWLWYGNKTQSVRPQEGEPSAKTSLYGENGSSGRSKIKLQFFIKDIPITIQVNSGSTHNFFYQSLVKNLKLATDPRNSFSVTVAKSGKVSSN